MESLMKRLGSFKNWAGERFRPNELAQAGFYNTSQDGNHSFTCHACGIKIQERKVPQELTVVDFHRMSSPNCPLVAVLSTGSVTRSFVMQPSAGASPSKVAKPAAVAKAKTVTPRTATATPATVESPPTSEVSASLDPAAAGTVPSVTHVATSLPQSSQRVQPSEEIGPSLGNISLDPSKPSWANRRHEVDHLFREFMFSEKNRLRSYFDFPPKESLTVIPEKLAAAGLFYSGEGDRVQCPFCGGKISQWENSDIPMNEHTKHFSHCDFVLGKTNENIPLFQLSAEPTRRREAVHKRYIKESERFTSFVGWNNINQSPQSMAKAGMFYTGMDDQVQCFMCGGSLRDWEPDDVPWKEHVKYYPDCPYVLENLSEWMSNESEPTPPQATQSSNPPSLVPTAPPQVLPSAPPEPTEQVLASLPPEQPMTPVVPMQTTSNTSLEFQRMKKRLEELQDRRTCKICMENEANISFVPCGHIACCSNCAVQCRQCPLCRRPIRDRLRVYLS